MDRGAWQVSVHGIADSDTTEAIEHAHMLNARRLFASGGQRVGTSASALSLPMNIEG